MDRRDCLDCFDLHHHERFYQKVNPEAEIKPHAVVDDWQWQLYGGSKAPLIEFMDQTSQIYTFQKSRSQTAVNFHRRIHDNSTDLVEMHLCVLRVLCGCILRSLALDVTIVT